MTPERQTGSEPRKILADPHSFAWDVPVPNDPARYGAKTILRMVKQANRRGRVRYYERSADGDELRWTLNPEFIKGVDDLVVFVAEALDSDGLFVSFEDRSDARTFARDLDALQDAYVIDRAAMAAEAERRAQLAASHLPARWPELVFFKKGEHSRQGGGKWAVMVTPSGQSAASVNAWMRANVSGRYWAGVWDEKSKSEYREGKWYPAPQPELAKASFRYYRLTTAAWQMLIDRATQESKLLLIQFHDFEDYAAFDAHYGPGQFLYRPRPKRADAVPRGALSQAPDK